MVKLTKLVIIHVINLFAKMLIGLPWYTIIQLLPVEKVKEMLTDEIIGALWPKSVQNQYKYVRQRLQEALPDYKIRYFWL